MKEFYLSQWTGERYIKQQIYPDSQFDVTKPISIDIVEPLYWSDFFAAYRPNEIFVDALQAQRMIMREYGTHKIEAIKLVRKLTGWGLKESKDFVEAQC